MMKLSEFGRNVKRVDYAMLLTEVPEDKVLVIQYPNIENVELVTTQQQIDDCFTKKPLKMFMVGRNPYNMLKSLGK